ncbi:MAG: helix-turn-helix domain-containing protein [Chitinivibrionales bacterium]|nr:helix-turn-helix domain-containing protein [Chitinivibrionales bacterium]
MTTSGQPIPGERTVEHPGHFDASRVHRLRPYVRQTGDDHRKPWLLRSRKLLDYLLVYIAKGTGRFTVGNHTFGVHRGDLIWIPPDTPHEMEGFAPVMHCVFAHFDLLYDPRRSHWDACIPGGVLDLTPWAEYLHPPLGDPVIDGWCGKLPIDNAPAIGTMLTELCVEHRRTAATNALLLSAAMQRIVGEILRGLTPTTEKTAHAQAIQSAVAYIQEHAGRPLDVARLADAVNLSESHFRKLFRELTGCSPRALHRRARIRKACELLVYDTGMNVSQVAYALGFSTVHNFSRAFRDVTGVAPSVYRRGG